MLLIKILFSPILWAIGFITPLFAQTLLASGLIASSTTAYTLAVVAALGWGAYAQMQGRWL